MHMHAFSESGHKVHCCSWPQCTIIAWLGTRMHSLLVPPCLGLSSCSAGPQWEVESQDNLPSSTPCRPPEPVNSINAISKSVAEPIHCPTPTRRRGHVEARLEANVLASQHARTG
jgi:hypothetical protein